MSKLAPAKLEGGAPLKPDELKLVESVVARPRSFWGRFMRGLAMAAKVVTKQDFEQICATVHKDLLDGKTLSPEEATATAKRVIEGYTQAHCTVHIPKCTCCDQAIMVVWLGEPRSGFLFQRHLRLVDPKGAKRG